MRLLARLLEPRATAHAHCDLPCGVYDPAQARIEAESVRAICEKYQQNDRPGLPHPRDPDQGGAVRPRQAPPVGAVDRLLQAAALREVPAAERAVQRGHQAGGRRRHQGQHRRGHRRQTARQDRRHRKDLLGDQAGLRPLAARYPAGQVKGRAVGDRAALHCMRPLARAARQRSGALTVSCRQGTGGLRREMLAGLVEGQT